METEDAFSSAGPPARAGVSDLGPPRRAGCLRRERVPARGHACLLCAVYGCLLLCYDGRVQSLVAVTL